MDNKNVALLPVIVLNYFAALTAGLLLFEGELSFNYIMNSPWIYISFVIGSLLIIGFYLIGYTTQKAGIAIATIANKMSVIIPILFSILYFAEETSILKTVGIILAIVSVVLAVLKKNKSEEQKKFSLLPLLMFLVIGVIDSAVKLAQHSYVSDEDVSLFTSFSFGLAGIIGVIILSFNPKEWKSFGNPWVWVFGILIGLANFGSMYFLILSLNHSGFDSSIVYGLNNMGIIMASIAIAILFFREKLSRVNIIGVVLALVSVAILTLLV